MNITITLNAEQQGALDDLVAAYNANRDEPVTATAYLQTVLLDIVVFAAALRRSTASS